MGLFNSEESKETIFEKPEIETTNSASEKNLKVQAAIVSDRDTVEHYSELKTLPNKESKEQATQSLEVSKMMEGQALINTAASAMADQNLPEENRVAIAENFQGIVNREQDSLQLLTQNLATSQVNANFKTEEVVTDKLAWLDEVTEYQQEMQKLHNSLEIGKNSTTDTLVDFALLMVPYYENLFTAGVVSNIQEGDTGAAAEALALLGSSKGGMREAFTKLSLTDRVEFAKILKSEIESSSGLLFPSDNAMAQADLFNTITTAGYYGDVDKWLDNTISVLDHLGVAMLLTPAKMAARASKVSKLLKRSKVQPASAARMAGQVNPEQARVMNQAALADDTGYVAEDLHGASVEDVALDIDSPQPRQEDGSVEDIAFNYKEEVDATIEENFLMYSDDEIETAQLQAKSKFDEVGPVLRHNSSPAPKFNDNGSTTYSNIYTMADSGWKSPTAALEVVKQQFRYYDVGEESFQLMQKQGNSFVPVDIAEVQAKIELRDKLIKAKKELPEELKKVNMQDEYAVQVNMTRDFDPLDVKHEAKSYALNFFDRFEVLSSVKKGAASLTRYLFDAASIFDKRISLSSAVAVDRASGLESLIIKAADDFVQPFKKLPEAQQEKLFNIIKKQNLLGKRITEGVTDQERKILDSWADTWDKIYELENKDLATSLKRGGFDIVVSKDGNLVGKSLKTRGQAPTTAQALDGATGEMISLTKADLDELYEKGGTLAKLRRPHVKGNDVSDYVINRNTSDNFLKEITSSDRVLNKREGYFSVRYEDPYFITKTIKRGGVEHTVAVKTASGVKAAKQLTDDIIGNAKTDLQTKIALRDKLIKAKEEVPEELNKAIKAEEGVTYSFRENRDLSSNEVDDFSWDVSSASGRLSQRVRGERLGSDLNDIEGAVQDPVNSLLSSARSIARRVPMRDWIDKTKLSFMDEFDEFVPTVQGQKVMPRTSADLVFEGSSKTSSRAADARSLLEYINSMEYGYRNGIDEGWRSMFNGIAEIVGAKSSMLESGARVLAKEGPSQQLRGRTFDLYLASNPLRQWVVQSHQATLLTANFPEYVLSQKLARETMAVHAGMFFTGDLTKKSSKMKAFEKLIGMSMEDARALAKEYKLTGLDASIDRHNLVENGLDEIMESQSFSSVRSLHKATIGRLRKVGFDAGERINIMTAWLAHRDAAVKNLKPGQKITDAKIRAEVQGKARNYTLNMNQAGEMPQNKNSLSLIFQFMQVPHKMLTTMLTNKVLTPAEKMKLAAYNIAMLPLPAALVYDLVEGFGGTVPEDPDLRDLAFNGIEGALLNKMAQLTFGDDTRIDYSSLTAADPTALYELVGSFISTDITEILSNTPSLSLVAGSNPRVGAMLEDVGSLFTAPNEENLEASVMSFLNMSSGAANFSKAYKERMFKDLHGRVVRRSSSGVITDTDITFLESVAKAFGFGTLDEAMDRVTSTSLYKETDEVYTDVEELAKQHHLALVRREVYPGSKEYAQRMIDIPEMQAMTSANLGFSQWTVGMREAYFNQLNKYISKGEDRVFKQILRANNLLPQESIDNALNATGHGRIVEIRKEIGEYVDGE